MTKAVSTLAEIRQRDLRDMDAAAPLAQSFTPAEQAVYDRHDLLLLIDEMRSAHEPPAAPNEVLQLLGNYSARAKLCDDGHQPLIHFDECPVCLEERLDALMPNEPA